MVCPESAVSHSTSSSWRAMMPSSTRSMAAVRSAGGMFGHGPWSKAFRAAPMARSTSCTSPRATFAMGSPVDGLCVSKDWPEAESTNSPPM